MELWMERVTDLPELVVRFMSMDMHQVGLMSGMLRVTVLPSALRLAAVISRVFSLLCLEP